MLTKRRPARRSDIWLHQTPSENALFDPSTGALHLLNDTALAIWELCDGETTPAEMIAAICEFCGMHRDIVTEDVERVLSDFYELGLVLWES